ncbi:hypothetical protein SELMODRAFT_68546, partial [Selaginella moellendorffii]
AADPDPLQDFCIPSNTLIEGSPCKPYSQVTSKDFYSSLLRTNTDTTNTLNPLFNFSQAIVTTFPALNTMGLSMARIYLGPKGVARTHTHPRASELVYVEKGVVEAGFVDTNNKLFAHKMRASDLFVIPRGVLHYVVNVGREQAIVLAVLNSQNPSFQIPSFALFGPKLPYEVLEASFSLNRTTIDAL